MSNFQISIMVVFGFFAVIAVLIFAGVLPGFNSSESGFAGEITMWGTVPEEKMRKVLDEFNQENEKLFRVVYEGKSPASFNRELTDALASGNGPDIFMMPSERVVSDGKKALPISYKTLPEGDFKNQFIEAGEIFMTDEGILSLPLVVDPLVMYWNRDIFSSAGVSAYPKFWDELLEIAPKVTVFDKASNVKRSAVAFGEIKNVTNGKEVLSMLILQTGNSIMERVGEGELESVIGRAADVFGSPAESATKFFMEFSNPSKRTYSWNRGLPESQDAFVSGDLAIYFGLGSEFSEITLKNPHLNFDVAVVPQIRDSKLSLTAVKIYGLSVAKNSPKAEAAFRAAYALASSSYSEKLSSELGLASPRRDTLSTKAETSHGDVFARSALIGKTWLDPDPEGSYNVFKDIVEGISSGKMTPSEAISQGSEGLNNLVR